VGAEVYRFSYSICEKSEAIPSVYWAVKLETGSIAAFGLSLMGTNNLSERTV
jgi:hypothetical protein